MQTFGGDKVAALQEGEAIEELASHTDAGPGMGSPSSSRCAMPNLADCSVLTPRTMCLAAWVSVGAAIGICVLFAWIKELDARVQNILRIL